MVSVFKGQAAVGSIRDQDHLHCSSLQLGQCHGQCLHEAVAGCMLTGLLLWMCVCVQEFVRNVRREVAKLKLLLQQYAIMSTQVHTPTHVVAA